MSDRDWAVTIAGRVAVCLLGVALVAAGGIGFALGRWWFQ